MKIFKLKDISEFIRNGVTIKQDISSKEGIPITRIETISKGTIDFNKLGYANISKIEKYKEWLLKKGDILISHINSEKHLGKSAIYLDNNYDIIHGMNLLCIRVIDKKVFPEYLQLFFKTNQYKKQIKKITKKSVNQASFSVNDFKEILITVPDLNIQEKIIKKIKVLEKILENNKLKLDYLSELTKSLFIRMFGDIRTNSKNWEIKNLDSIYYIRSSKRIFEKDYKKEGVPFFRSKEIVELSNSKNIIPEIYISFDKYEELKKASGIPLKDDLLITAVGTIGKIWKVNYEKDFYFKDGNLIWLQLKNKNQFNTLSLKRILEDSIKNEKENLASGSAYNALTIDKLKKFNIIMPPIELQNKFAERVEKIEKLSFEIEKSIKEAENLYNSLINKYFD
ncbi:restriction endonuclease subunit S [Fusobacterium polymorphum]|uniref:restriction endonuclease subunit S n=1 Tax=Fusobacterium nucleatum subsp. polymorphum TaxID=76857 RepID=UPI002B4BD39E|nr:restriction endonuclease subunit S [Fusobacterium polymorphum]WRL71202.1 restriction endonuclease subunit S [Fusobacterium polymorphum]